MTKEQQNTKVDLDRQMLLDAKARGWFPLLGVYTRLSGPGWLQSAITLGGGSLAGALLLGVLGGTSMLWLQMMAITFGVIMLSAISFVTLSTGKRPLQAINDHINPALGWGWVLATVLANIIWVMPQFGLSFAALQKNLVPGGLAESSRYYVSAILLAAALTVVLLNSSGGTAAKIFDYFLKGLVGIAVISFFGVVVYLSVKGELNWSEIFAGFIPNLNQWNEPAGKMADLVANAPAEYREYWSSQLVEKQRSVMIGAAATAVGINMTFLLPYSLLRRGWDKPFRGAARFDLLTGMAIPYILVTSCVVIAASSAFHGKVDDAFLSSETEVVLSSPTFESTSGFLEKRIMAERGQKVFAKFAVADGDTDEQKEIKAALKEFQIAEYAAELPAAERKLSAALVKRDAFQLSRSLSPLLGDQFANTIFGIGVFAMGFSTIIILMLINGYAFCEIYGKPDSKSLFAIGCLVSGFAGAMWPMFWGGESKFWLTIMASVFGMMLLPIAYLTFFIMLNSRKIMGDEKPTGVKMMVWNVLMFVAVAGAIIAAVSAVTTKASDKSRPEAFYFVVGLAVVYGIMVIIGFFLTKKAPHGSEKS